VDIKIYKQLCFEVYKMIIK